MSRYVLDAWAVLAHLQQEEPAGSEVQALYKEAIPGAGDEPSVQLFMSVINLGEIYYRIARVKGDGVADQTIQMLYRTPLQMIPATEVRVFAAARLKGKHAISYADAFAVATAMELAAILVTGDPEIIQLGPLLPLKILTRH
jgi:predicted nucleic acid-binding protein